MHAPPHHAVTQQRDAAVHQIIGREDVLDELRTALLDRDGDHLHLYGPRGSGKTLLATSVLEELPSSNTMCYISGIEADTQYQVLLELCNQLTETRFQPGYHPAQLINRATAALAKQNVVVVLDDAEFLLQNDGSTLLYSLSRLDPGVQPRLVLVSNVNHRLDQHLDDRTASSFQPHRLTFDPYSTREAQAILADYATVRNQEVTDSGLNAIATATRNIRLGQAWLDRVNEVCGDVSATIDLVQTVRGDALRRYHTELLHPFSRHHAVLLRAITGLTQAKGMVYTGDVYERYRALCRFQAIEPFSTRQLSDYLVHLDLLGLIRMEYFYGGVQGKTRRIWLPALEEL